MSATSKLVKAWESKTNQRAMKAGGGLTMALTLAACGGSSDTAAEAPAVVETPVTPVANAPVAMTADEKIYRGDENNDTFTATSTTFTGKTVIDDFAADSDTLEVTLTAALATDNVVDGIENVNLIWNAFGTATTDLEDISGATVTLSSTKVGFLGSATVSNAGDNDVVAGSGMSGTLTVTGVKTGAVDGASAKVMSVTAAGTATADDTTVVTAGADTTKITVADFDSATVNAGTAKTVILTDDDAAADDENTVELTIGANTTLTNNVDDLTITAAAADLSVTIDAVDASLTIAGDNAVTLKAADLFILNGEVVSAAGSAVVATADVSDDTNLKKVDASSFTFESTIGEIITVSSGANVTLEKDAGASTSFVVGSSSSDVLNLSIESDQAIITSDAETTNVTVDAKAKADAADITITALTGGEDYVFTSANDFNIDGVVAADVNAAAVTGAFDLDQGTAGALDVTGSASAKNTVTFTGTTQTNNYTGGTGVDSVDFATTTGSAVAVVSDGDNVIDMAHITTGNGVVNAGDGKDTVTATALTTGVLNLSLGGGDDTATINGVLAGATIVVEAGAGDDKVSLLDSTAAGDEITMNFGDGTDTLVLGAAESIALGTFNATGLDVIAMTGGGAASTVAADFVSGKDYNITASNAAGDIFTVVGDVAAGETIDLSSLTIDQTLTKAVISTSITGNAGDDTINGTDIADAIASNGGDDTLTGGLGKDTYTLGAGKDTVVIATADTGNTVAAADVVTSFTSGTDKLSLGTAGKLENYTEIAGVDGDALAETAVDVNAAMDGTVKYVYVYGLDVLFPTGGSDTDDGALFVDADMDGTFDDLIIITGGDVAGDLTHTDIIA